MQYSPAIFKTRADQLGFQLKTAFWLFLTLTIPLLIVLLLSPIGHPVIEQQRHSVAFTFPLLIATVYFFISSFWRSMTALRHTFLALFTFFSCYTLLAFSLPLNHSEHLAIGALLSLIALLNVWIGRQLLAATHLNNVQVTITIPQVHHSDAFSIDELCKWYPQGNWKIHAQGASNSRGVYFEQLDTQAYELTHFERLVFEHHKALLTRLGHPCIDSDAAARHVLFIGYHTGLSIVRLFLLQKTISPMEFAHNLRLAHPHWQVEIQS